MSDLLDASEAESPAPRRRLAPFVALAVALVLGALFIVLARGKGDKADVVQSFLVNKPAPAVISTTLDGKPFDLSRRKGSVVVLNFFNSTCIPCKREHPELINFVAQQRQLGADGAELYTVVDADSDSNVRAWFRDHGGDWPIVTDDDGSISTAFGVAQVPETWIIDGNGIIRVRIPGPTTSAQIAQLVQQVRLAA